MSAILICMDDLGEAAEGGVRPLGVEVHPLGLDDASGIIQPIEEMFVQALIAKATVEALDESILGRLASAHVVSSFRGLCKIMAGNYEDHVKCVVRVRMRSGKTLNTPVKCTNQTGL